MEREIELAMERLQTQIALFANDLSQRPVPARLGNDREYAMQSVVIILHSRGNTFGFFLFCLFVLFLLLPGINVRYLGAIRNGCVSEYWRLQLLISMVARRLKRRLFAQMRNFHLG